MLHINKYCISWHTASHHHHGTKLEGRDLRLTVMIVSFEPDMYTTGVSLLTTFKYLLRFRNLTYLKFIYINTCCSVDATIKDK